ncbi:uncharacterized protein B0P05DRAFT_581261 [Gilbertella persicaria]|uniref:uncharacterized protein n=1 Tax=Gilbertella persicaria TaxID=101096 RepID=UPI00221ECDD9|nr:uncharacterized protein B0P05DRAFT_581261 [Gilbertella persicaria]KAI8061852.1 hypothetical protein B0P05DRAFT_581261 [Gilbertella persicaria]
MNEFLKQHTCYDVLPISFRLVVFDTYLPVKKALSILVQNGIVSAPLWSSDTQEFAGMLTVSDFISLIQYYYTNPKPQQEIDYLRIHQLKKQKAISADPTTTLFDAAILMSETRAHRIPLIARHQDQTMIISIITQYRLLKFIANNFKQIDLLKIPLSTLKIGTYGDKVATAYMSTPVIDIIKLLADLNISAVPILDENNTVLNLYDTIDVMSLVRSERYNDLDLPVSQTLKSRPKDYPGVCTCTVNDTLYSIFKTIRKKRVYRLVVIEPDTYKLVGLLSLSDILGYIVTI